MYWVYEHILDRKNAIKSFQLQDEAVEYANKQRVLWRNEGVDRHFSVYYFETKVYEN